MTIYVVARGRIASRPLLDEYVSAAVPTIASHGGRVVAFDESSEAVEGPSDMPRTVVLQFPSREAFCRWYESPEYQAVLPMRFEAAPGSLVLARGFEEQNE